MRIILDSNIYVADFRMAGISFSNLFDFIRKTQSTLIIPRIVREEVIQRYIDRFNEQVRQTAKSWKAFQYLMLDREPAKFEKPELKYQIRELRRRLRVPVKGVITEYFPDVSGVDVNEVALRGIRRTPPASQDGEELRDVLIWFQVLSLAKTKTEITAFISADAGFWDGDVLRGQILQDIATSKGSVQVHKNIDTFIKANSPRQIKLTADTANQLIPASLFSDAVAPKFAQSLKRAAGMSLTHAIFGCYGGEIDVVDVKPLASQFLEGTTYEIDSAVSFISATYEYESKAVLKLRPQGAWQGTVPLSSLMGPVVVAQNPFGPLAQANSFWAPFQETISSMDESDRTKEVVATGRASVSARVVDGLVAEKAVEAFDLTELQIESKKFGVSEVIGPRGAWLKSTPVR